MIKNIILFINLFSLVFLDYLPMSNIIDQLHIEKICHYKEYNSIDEYVRPCEEGLYCAEIPNNKHEIHICQNYTSSIKFLGENCSSRFECDNNLECIEKKCTVKKDSQAYEKNIKVSNEKLYYCPDDFIAVNNGSDFYFCNEKNNSNQNKCYFENNGKPHKAAPGFFQVCGIINKDNNLKITSIETSDIANQKDGDFVWDEKACQSGYAVYYPLNGNLSETNIDSMYKRCVTVTGVEKGDNDCIIKYKINEEERIYNVGSIKKLNNTNNISIDGELFEKCEFLMEKLDLFKIYKKRLDYLETKGTDCKNKKLYNESFTCGDDYLRKLWYSYNNPEFYLLYKDEPEVFDYLIKKAYPSYNKTNIDETIEQTGSSTAYLDIKYFIAFLLLLIF